MDSDDICLPERFELQLQAFMEDSADIIGGDIAEFIDKQENIVGYRRVPTFDSEVKRYLRRRCPFNQMTVMFKKSAVMEAGGYLDWYCDEDYYLWLRMYLKGKKFRNVGRVLVHVRVGADMYQRRGGWRYFKSEAKLQAFMLQKHIISFPEYVINTGKRLIVQVLLPNSVRGWVFRQFARE